MTTQKCIITFVDGTQATYVGAVQFDVENKKRVKKIQFSVPIEDADDEVLPEDDGVKQLKNIFGMR